MAEGIFDLQDEANAIDTASTDWAHLATALRDAGDHVATGAQAVADAGWEGDTRDSWEGHRRQLVKSLDLGGAIATRVASQLSKAAGSVRVAQGHLDAQWAAVVGVPHTHGPGGALTFRPRDDAEREQVTKALAEATSIRAALDRALREDRTALTEATADWTDLASTWLAVANGAPPFDLPEDADSVGVIQVGDRTIFDTGAGDDTVTIEIDKETGDQIVTINGQVYRVPADQHVVIRAGEGNDEIRVPDGWDIDFTALGGEGDDAVRGGAGDETVLGLDGRDRIETGEGDDYGSGGADRDYLDGGEGDDTLSGGTGDDTAYGLDGDDTVTGGDGADYLEGGEGDDTLGGGDGDDILSGGTDDDTIHGGTGDDVSYAGRGDDTTHAGSGSDTSHSETGDTDTGAEHRVTVEIKGVPEYIEIEGSPEFVARVRADLEMLASSPRGAMMLQNLLDNYEDSGFLGIGRDGLTIREEVTDGNSAYEGGGGSGNVNYNPSRDYSVDDRPPVVGLYHELAHVYDYVNETKRGGEYDGDDTTDHGIDVDERQGTGLPIDHDDDPDTPEIIDPDHPIEYTENGLREELGLDDREHYVG